MKLNVIRAASFFEQSDGAAAFSVENLKLEQSNVAYSDDDYICISYAWGREIVDNPFYPGHQMSSRTLPVLNTAVEVCKKLVESNLFKSTLSKIWIDSLCVPLDASEREMHLSLLGDIYSYSNLCIVVLSERVAPVFSKFINSIQLAETDLAILNQEEWISRYWTYQEMVNSDNVYFTPIGHPECAVDAGKFFDVIANEMQDIFSEIKNDPFIVMLKYPFVISLEALISDFNRKGTNLRSVYQILSNMEHRTSENYANRIKASLCCVSGQFISQLGKGFTDFQILMELCFQKCDFSFIFNNAVLRSKDRRKWMPENEDFKPVFPYLYCFGDMQAGVLHDEYLELQDMILPLKAKVDDVILGRLKFNLLLKKETERSQVLEECVSCLRQFGFSGTDLPIELENGFYFDQFQGKIPDDCQVAVSRNVAWPFGAAAILVRKREGSEIYDFISSGVFFGSHLKEQHNIKID